MFEKNDEKELEKWGDLQTKCENCTNCNLCHTRTHVVFGEGNLQSKIFFIGEAPGENEDLQARPFVGKSGILLDNMLKSIGLSRSKNVYIANIIKCRPPNNRNPTNFEQEECISWLKFQLRFINPKIIVTLGRIPSKIIISNKIKISEDHGKFFTKIIDKRDFLIMPMLHPSAILRNIYRKVVMEKDFLLLNHKMNELNIWF
ncbi:MAG: uracil-DNA glycosylase [Candidatus Improbicoccus devescovinae]|nr:MAG: uracil-DNA glycosylase [Candidatus Improbicoccus devescovinae]